MATYTAVYSRDGNGWMVNVVGLPGCHTQGPNLAMARGRIREALGLYLDNNAKEAESKINEIRNDLSSAAVTALQEFYEDKSDWGPGPWQDEPDRLEWVDETTGLPCAIFRSPTCGNLCGYVAVFPDHPLFGEEEPSDRISTSPHGGITFAGTLECLTMFPCRSADLWWFGFDCGHHMDYMPLEHARRKRYLRSSNPDPQLERFRRRLLELEGPVSSSRPRHYKNISYVKVEIRRFCIILSRTGKEAFVNEKDH